MMDHNDFGWRIAGIQRGTQNAARVMVTASRGLGTLSLANCDVLEMLRSALSSTIWPIRLQLSRSPLLPTRTFCLATSTTRALCRSLVHARLPAQAPGSQAAFSVSPLQRWLSTTSRMSLRYHVPPRREPPRYQLLGFLDTIPENNIFYGILGINAIVFGMWYMADQQYARKPLPLALGLTGYWGPQNTNPVF